MSGGAAPLKTVQSATQQNVSASITDSPTKLLATGNVNISCNSSLPINDLDVIQDMIDCSADRLEGLRTQCVTSAMLTQTEIRSLETKLLRMFSELLLTKSRLNERLPASGLPQTSGNELRQWLRVVGLSQESLNVCLTRLSTLEQLLDLSDTELKELLQLNQNYKEEEVRRLTKAMESLRKCKGFLSDEFGTIAGTHLSSNIIAKAEKGNNNCSNNKKEQYIEQLFWDSWDRNNHHHPLRCTVNYAGKTASPRSYRSYSKYNKQSQKQLSSETRQSPCIDSCNFQALTTLTTISADRDSSNVQGSLTTLTITPSPPNSPFTPTTKTSSFSNIYSGMENTNLNGTPRKIKIAATPPTMKKHLSTLCGQQSALHIHPSLVHHHAQPVQFSKDHSSPSLPKYKNSESLSSSSSTMMSSPSTQFSNIAKKHQTICGNNTRLHHADPSPDSHSSASSDIVVEISSSSTINNLQVPLSPCTPIVNHLGMSHSIAHRFHTVLKVTSTTCDLCQKPMFLGRKCKECKYRCHKLCEPDVPPSCCLPPEFIDEFKNAIKDQVSGNFHSTVQHTPPTLNTHSPSQSLSYGTLGKGRMGITSSRHQKHGSTVSTTFHGDSSSPGSSCNSSSPSSPALFHLHQHQNSQNSETVTCLNSSNSNVITSSVGGSSSASSNMLSTPSSQKNLSQFNFPDVTITLNCNDTSSTTETILSSESNISPAHYDIGDNFQKPRINGKSEMNSSIGPLNSSIGSAHHGTKGPVNTSMNSDGGIIKPNTVCSTTASNSDVTDRSSTFFQRKLSSAGLDKRGGRLPELSDTHKSNDSDKTVSLSGSTSASTDSDRTPVRLDSTEDGDSGNWPRQNSLSLKEWDIPYSDLNMREKIGQGRFGTVHRALWHGWVAVKLLKEDYLDDEHMLEAFKLEVANFKKTRHENIVLFMGACMNPPYLAIVTSLCKGNTLFTHIHTRQEKFVINKTTLIAQQITQGMGYLHARGIIHKDLRTKNIFLENGKVIITDFGLFSSTKLQYDKRGLGITTGWLCYIAPELMRCLMPCKPSEETLPFSAASDVYSFGTVWYELLCGEFPFKAQPAEAVIWQVGRGMKQTLANIQTSRDVKDILMLCWHYTADDRPDFPKLLTMFERLPKKRLARSPSHPVQLSRSAEAIF